MSWRQTNGDFLPSFVTLWHIHWFFPITHPPTPNLQKIYKIELGRMPFPGRGACVVCNWDSGPKIPCKHVGLYWAGFLHLKMGAQKMGSSLFESYLKTITMLSTSIHPIIPQQDLSSSGTQTCSCLLQLHYWTLGLFILL